MDQAPSAPAFPPARGTTVARRRGPGWDVVSSAEPTIELLLARQPILDLEGTTTGYELLYRSPAGSASVTGDAATASVLVDGILGHGLAQLTGGLPAWVNVPEPLLLDGTLDAFVGKLLVIEILEDTPDTPDVRAAIRDLRARGSRVALDDVVADDPRLGLVGQVDVVKIDLLATTPAQRRSLVALARRHGTTVLFEKVETAEMAAEAADAGADLIQGYFFAHPLTQSRRDVPLQHTNRLRLLQLLYQPDIDLAEVEEVVRQDVYLAGRFLAFVNSASFGWRRHIDSIHHALVLVGTESLRRWLGLVTLAASSSGRPSELLVVAATRARFCENLAPATGMGQRRLDLFCLGMFSMLGAILDAPAAETLAPMSLADDVRAALLDQPSPLTPLLEVAQAMEAVDWPRAQACMVHLGLDAATVGDAYQDALQWSAASGRLAG